MKKMTDIFFQIMISDVNNLFFAFQVEEGEEVEVEEFYVKFKGLWVTCLFFIHIKMLKEDFFSFSFFLSAPVFGYISFSQRS